MAKPKPLRVTLMRIFIKNLFLLTVLWGLFLPMIIKRPPDLKSEDPIVETQLEISDIEMRIAEIEAFLKTTTTMTQVQLEMVDRKLNNEIGGMRREIYKKIEDESVILGHELKKLEEKREGLDMVLSELKGVDELKKSLDYIRVYAMEVVVKEIEKHAADGVGRVDYAIALATNRGAGVVKHSEPFVVGKGTNLFSMISRGRRHGVHSHADKMLKPSFGEPGQCFSLKGDRGFVQIKLRTAIIPEAITLEHVAKSVAYNQFSAPKDCRVSGWLQGPNNDLPVAAEKMLLLTEFIYNLNKSSAQTFNVLDSPGSDTIVDTIRLDFTSNHGSPSHTCIYRFRVHGHEPGFVSMLGMHHQS